MGFSNLFPEILQLAVILFWIEYNAKISTNIESILRNSWDSDSKFVTITPTPPKVEMRKKPSEEHPTHALVNVPKIVPEIVVLLSILFEFLKIKIFILIIKPINEAVSVDIMNPITASLGR
jgi:hypothetical protein